MGKYLVNINYFIYNQDRFKLRNYGNINFKFF